MVTTAAQVIDSKGGPAAFAERIGVGPGAVRMMKFRNRIPRSVWPEVVEAFPDLSLEVLKAIEATNTNKDSKIP